MGIMPTCKEIHHLTSDRMDRDLTPVERLRMRLHLRICNACTIFFRRLILIRRAMHSLAEGGRSATDRDAQ
jgi:predicted anti-sigma-YlaC factor YlaD